LTSSTGIYRKNLTGVLPTKKLANRKKECDVTEATLAILNSSPYKNELKSADVSLKAKRGRKSLPLAKDMENKYRKKKKKITYFNFFIDYKEEVQEEEKDDYGNFYDDDDYYYFYTHCLYSKSWYLAPTEGWIICSKCHNYTQSSQ
jgi:hypothetical protein